MYLGPEEIHTRQKLKREVLCEDNIPKQLYNQVIQAQRLPH